MAKYQEDTHIRRLIKKALDLILSPLVQLVVIGIIIAGCVEWNPIQEYHCPHFLPVGYGLNIPITYLPHGEIAEKCGKLHAQGCVNYRYISDSENYYLLNKHIYIHRDLSNTSRSLVLYHELCHFWEVENNINTPDETYQHLGWIHYLSKKG